MRLRGFIAAAVGGAALAAASAANAALLITIDKSTQRMSVSRDGAPLHSWPVSTGKPGYSTPGGSYTPFRLEQDHFSKEWDDAPMPHSIFFTKRGHAIHGTLESRRLGAPASHGCVRLAPKNAETLFALVKQEGLNQTKIVLTGDEAAAVARRSAPARVRPPIDADLDPVEVAPAPVRDAYGRGFGRDNYARVPQPGVDQPLAPQYERPYYGPQTYTRSNPYRNDYYVYERY
jgi:hypothetical protein